MLLEIDKDITVEDALKVANAELLDGDEKDNVIKELNKLYNKKEKCRRESRKIKN